jgi:integrase
MAVHVATPDKAKIMQREKLTPERIRRFNCLPESKQAFLFDTDAPRLAVRATQAGAKSFIFEAKLNRQTIRITIGDVRAWNLDDGRSEARRLQTLVDQGIDPRELEREKQEAKAAAKAAKEAAKLEIERRKRYTLRALCEAYCKHLKTKGKVKSARDALSAFRVHLFGSEHVDSPASEIAPEAIAGIVRKVRESGKERTAGVLRNYLVAAYNAARRAPFDTAMLSDLIDFEIKTNPAEPVPAIQVQRGDRTLSSDELKIYMETLGDDDADQLLKTALYAGCQRMAQLARAKVSDYMPDTGTLRLLDPKGKRNVPREHLIQLGPKAKAIVKTLTTERPTAESKIFVASKRAAGDRVAEICAAMKVPHFDLRDIRRTCETMLAGMGVTKETRAQLLSHGLGGVQDAHYDRHSYAKEKHAALVAWERRLDEIATGQSAKNIIQLKRKGRS